MINFEFTRPTDENPEGIIKVSVDYESINFFNDTCSNMQTDIHSVDPNTPCL